MTQWGQQTCFSFKETAGNTPKCLLWFQSWMLVPWQTVMLDSCEVFKTWVGRSHGPAQPLFLPIPSFLVHHDGTAPLYWAFPIMKVWSPWLWAKIKTTNKQKSSFSLRSLWLAFCHSNTKVTNTMSPVWSISWVLAVSKQSIGITSLWSQCLPAVWAKSQGKKSILSSTGKESRAW